MAIETTRSSSAICQDIDISDSCDEAVSKVGSSIRRIEWSTSCKNREGARHARMPALCGRKGSGMRTGSDVHIKRVYAARTEQDGKRILVDRLWPRGLTKEKAAVDLWLKDIAPSNELRKWFGHDSARWPEFQKRYRDELKKIAGSVSVLKQEAENGPVTLLFGAKDEDHNEAVVLRSLLMPRPEAV